MTTTIRGNSGKKELRELLEQHDACMETMKRMEELQEPLRVVSTNTEAYLEVSALEVFSILQARLLRINTKLENLGLKIGDDVAESATPGT